MKHRKCGQLPSPVEVSIWIGYRSQFKLSAQLRAGRALLDIDQRTLAGLCRPWSPNIQRMESSPGLILGNVDSLMKLVTALEAAGIELIAENAASSGGGRGVRLKKP
jgi:hypothetical protein